MTVPTTKFGFGPLAGALQTDLFSFGGSFPEDSAELALQLLSTEVKNKDGLIFALSKSTLKATHALIREACGRTILFHSVVMSDGDLATAADIARVDIRPSMRDDLTHEIVSHILKQNGRMDAAVDTVFRNFDPPSIGTCPPEALMRFFWACLDVDTDKTGRPVTE